MSELTAIIEIKSLIYEIRGQKIMLDRDLAMLYGVPTKRLNEAVKRNIKRFPENFMFKLNDIELKELVANCDRFKNLKHSVSAPHAFTEYGVAMLSSVLNSEKAIEINIQIIQTFINIRQYVLEHKDLSKRLDKVEQYLIEYANSNNIEIKEIKKAIDLLMDRTKPAKIGF